MNRHDRYPFFGEMGLLHRKPCMVSAREARCTSPRPDALRPHFCRGVGVLREQATVRVTSPGTRCICFSHDNFHRLMTLVPDFEDRVKAIDRARQKQNQQTLRKKIATKEIEQAVSNENAAAALAIVRSQRFGRHDKLFFGALSHS